MPKFTLKYFNGRGSAEVARYLFAVAGVDYEDKRIDSDAWRGGEKQDTPFGQLPVLVVDGQSFGQSGAIFRFLADEFNLYGKNNIDRFRIEEVFGIQQDIIIAWLKYRFEKDEAKKAEYEKDTREVKLPQHFGSFEKCLKRKGTDEPYILGNSISLADIIIFDVADKVKDLVTLDKFPAVKKCVESVANNPKISEWINKRPQTPF